MDLNIFDEFWSITNISIIVPPMVPNLTNISFFKWAPESFWYDLTVSACFLTIHMTWCFRSSCKFSAPDLQSAIPKAQVSFTLFL